MIRLEAGTAPQAPEPAVERFIVEIRNGIPIPVGFDAVLHFVREGRISKTNGKPHHCHSACVAFDNGTKGTIVCIPNRKSERFVVMADPEKPE